MSKGDFKVKYKVDTSYQAYENYMSNMIVQDQENIMDYDDWINAMNTPTPDEFKTVSEEISFEDAEKLGVIWTSADELKEMGLDDE